MKQELERLRQSCLEESWNDVKEYLRWAFAFGVVASIFYGVNADYFGFISAFFLVAMDFLLCLAVGTYIARFFYRFEWFMCLTSRMHRAFLRGTQYDPINLIVIPVWFISFMGSLILCVYIIRWYEKIVGA